MDPLGVPMNRAGSGTTWIPDAVQLPTHNFMAERLASHAAWLSSSPNTTSKSGDRGDDQFGSLNWGMFMASRTVKGGRLQFRTMLSRGRRDRWTARVSVARCNLARRTTDEPVHDRQHPHDFFMELGRRRTNGRSQNRLAFHCTLLHQVSRHSDQSRSCIVHHRWTCQPRRWAITGRMRHTLHSVSRVQDLFTHNIKVEGSVFNGREPNQHRWDFDKINFDSYSARISFNPNKNWALTTGYGHLKSPEALHPEESVNRLVASAMYGREIGDNGQWASTLVYGQNKHSESSSHTFAFPLDNTSDVPARTHSLLLESEIISNKHTFFARIESVQKSAEDLVLPDSILPLLAKPLISVKAFSLGYVHEIGSKRSMTLGIGGMATFNAFPSGLDLVYTRSPLGGMLFARIRPQYKRGGDTMPGMDHSKM